MKINAIFFIPSAIPLTPEGGTMADKHSDVRGTMVPPSGVRGTLAKNIAINIWKNLITVVQNSSTQHLASTIRNQRYVELGQKLGA